MAEHTVSLETARLNLAKENPALAEYMDARARSFAIAEVAAYVTECWQSNADKYTLVDTVWRLAQIARRKWLTMLPDTL